MIEISNLSKSFSAPGGEDTIHVFNDVNLKVENGSSAAIVGPSGSGKSTLLNIIGHLDKPTSGMIMVNEQNLSTLEGVAVAEYRNQTVGFVFQSHHLLPSCTVLENVILPALSGFGTHEGEELNHRASELLKTVGLGHRITHLPNQISGGESQRVAVARALINSPSVLLADEPTGALDQKNSDHLVDLLKELNEEKGVTLLMVTHSLDGANQMKKSYRFSESSLRQDR